MGCNGNSWNYSHPHTHIQRLILLTLEISFLSEIMNYIWWLNVIYTTIYSIQKRRESNDRLQSMYPCK